MTRPLLILLLLAGTAHADVVTHHVEGEATGDATTGRTAALDSAFYLATDEVVNALLTGAQSKQWINELKTEVYARARLWVSSFKVTSQKEDGGRLILQVDVKIDEDKVRDKLVELGISIAGTTTVVREEPAAGARDAVLLLRVSTIEAAYYTFGEGHDEGVPGAEDAEVSLARRGLALVPVASQGAASAKGLPIGDDGARELARDADAAVAIVASVDVGAPGRVRGALGVACLARAQVRVVDVASGRVLGTAQAARGATGDAASIVSATALRAALLEALAVALPRREPTSAVPALPLPAAGKGETLMRIRGSTGAEAEAIRAYVASASTTKKISLRRIGADELVYAVKGSGADRLAALVRGGAGLDADARVADGAVEVSVVQTMTDLPDISVPW